jgi:lipopolysaccharide biosynthesis glycosyltransferase
MLQSLWTHNPYPDLNVYLVYDSIDSEQLGEATSFLSELLPSISILKASAKPFEAFPVNGHVSVAAYFRLLLPDLLPSSMERVIFIDADTIITDSLDDLWNQSLQGNALAAVREHKLFCVHHNHQYGHYFNAGIMLIDLMKWRQTNLISKGHRFAIEIPEKLRHSDQDVLNLVFENNWLNLPDRWNACPHLFGLTGGYDLTPEALSTNELEAIQHPAIVHFAGSGRDKPWNAHCRHPLKDRYLEARSLTPWANEVLDEQPPSRLRQRYNETLFRMKCLARSLYR